MELIFGWKLKEEVPWIAPRVILSLSLPIMQKVVIPLDPRLSPTSPVVTSLWAFSSS